MAFSLLPSVQDAVFFVYNFWQQLLPQRDGVPQATTRERKKLIVVSFPVFECLPCRFSPRPASVGSTTRFSGEHSAGPPTGTEHAPPALGGSVFIKSFVFAPELPIRIDYEGKRFSTEELVGCSC